MDLNCRIFHGIFHAYVRLPEAKKRSVCESPGGCFGTHLGGIPEDQGREDCFFCRLQTHVIRLAIYIYIP